MHALDFIDRLPETEEARIFRYLHNLLSSYPGIVPKVHFNTPFYTRNRWLAYVSGQKKGGVELCFVHADKFKKHRESLDFKKRKQVGGILFFSETDIDPEVVDRLMNEALRVDDEIIPKSKRKPAKGDHIP